MGIFDNDGFNPNWVDSSIVIPPIYLPTKNAKPIPTSQEIKPYVGFVRVPFTMNLSYCIGGPFEITGGDLLPNGTYLLMSYSQSTRDCYALNVNTGSITTLFTQAEFDSTYSSFGPIPYHTYIARVNGISYTYYFEQPSYYLNQGLGVAIYDNKLQVVLTEKFDGKLGLTIDTYTQSHFVNKIKSVNKSNVNADLGTTYDILTVNPLSLEVTSEGLIIQASVMRYQSTSPYNANVGFLIYNGNTFREKVNIGETNAFFINSLTTKSVGSNELITRMDNLFIGVTSYKTIFQKYTLGTPIVKDFSSNMLTISNTWIDSGSGLPYPFNLKPTNIDLEKGTLFPISQNEYFMRSNGEVRRAFILNTSTQQASYVFTEPNFDYEINSFYKINGSYYIPKQVAPYNNYSLRKVTFPTNPDLPPIYGEDFLTGVYRNGNIKLLAYNNRIKLSSNNKRYLVYFDGDTANMVGYLCILEV
jgi:hypothetical protein